MRTLHGLAALAIVAPSAPSAASIGRDAVTSLKLSVYGMYMTKDPTCQKDLVATMPLVATPVEVDVVTKATLGKGKVPASIGCVTAVKVAPSKDAVRARNVAPPNAAPDSKLAPSNDTTSALNSTSVRFMASPSVEST